MDIRSAIRPIIVALVSIGLIVLVVGLFIKGFSGGAAVDVNRVDVSKYSSKPAVATLFIDGPTNLNQDHNQLRITVSGTLNEIDIMQGYQGNIIRSETYANNTTAFDTFLQSLQLLNFSKGRKAPTNYQGYCPTGNRYTYSFNDGQTDLFKFWSTTCGNGTFEGKAPAVRSLFRQQIPQRDFNAFVTSTDINY